MHLVRNCARILVLMYSLKRTVFRERSSRKTMSLKELFLSEDKRSSIISRRMEATVSIILCNIFAARKTKCSRKVYLSLTWMFTFQCSLVRLHKQTKICPFSAKSQNTVLSWILFLTPTLGTHLENITRFSFVFGGVYLVTWRFETKGARAKTIHGLQFTAIH